jgi:hypothetical protein
MAALAELERRGYEVRGKTPRPNHEVTKTFPYKADEPPCPKKRPHPGRAAVRTTGVARGARGKTGVRQPEATEPSHQKMRTASLNATARNHSEPAD